MNSQYLLSNIISLYPSVITVVLFCLAMVKRNVYLLYVLAGVLSSEIPVFILQSTIKSPRPIGGQCNVLSIKPTKNGFPSGHTTFSTFILVYVLHQYHVRNEQNAHLSTVLITNLFGVLTPFARVQKRRHTVPQVLAGLILGSFWAGIYMCIEQHFFMSDNNYQTGKNLVWN